MTVFTSGDPPRSRRHLHVFMACVLILALLPIVYLAAGCSPEQAIEGTTVFVHGLSYLVELHLTVVLGSLGLALIGAVVYSRTRR